MAQQRTRSFIITINNPTDESIEAVKQLKTKYIILGNETAPTTGTKHIQGFFMLTNPTTINAIKSKLIKTHIEPIKGTPKQAADYCRKEGDILYEEGEAPKGAGKRTDLETVREAIADGANMRSIIDTTATNYQSIKTAEIIFKYKELQRNWKPLVKWYWGATGTGKTRLAYEETPPQDRYITMDTGKWWEGYDGQSAVIIDDIRKDFLPFSSLLKLLDRYAYRIESKGSSRQFLAKVIIITCPQHPSELFKHLDEDINQLLRRIDEIRQFG